MITYGVISDGDWDAMPVTTPGFRRDDGRPCSKCGKRAPEAEFRFRKNGYRYAQCRACMNKTDAPMRNYGPDRPCTNCGRRPPEVTFLFRANGKRNSMCRECKNKTDAPIRKYGPDRPCSKCGLSAPDVAFSIKRDGERNSWCNDCKNERDNQYRADIKADPERYKSYLSRGRLSYKKHIEADPLGHRLQRRDQKARLLYGLTLEQVHQIWVDQEGRCGICQRPILDRSQRSSNGGKDAVHIDHCHATGRVRGLLCGPCNQMLGMAKDNPAYLRAGADWIEAHQQR